MVRSLRSGDIAATLAAERLGVPAVLYFVLSAAAPLTVVAGVVTTAYAVTGNTGLPAAFVAIGILLAVFSVGYVAMSRHLPHAGAFYAYASHGLGRSVGVGTAWVSLLAYNLLQVGLYGIIGTAAGPLVQGWASLDLPWWVYAVLAWTLVALLGVARVDVSGIILAVLLICEVTLVVGYAVTNLTHPAPEHTVAWASLTPDQLLTPGAGAMLAIAVLGFIGFESAAVFTEESRDPVRTIPRSTYLAVAVIAVLYAGSAVAMATATGTDRIVDSARAQGPDLLFALAGSHLGEGWATVGRVLFATSVLAAMISFHNTIARYVFALGREHVLPPVFGRTSTSGSPRAASIAQTTLGLVVIVVYAVGGWDPVLGLFYLGGAAGALGILTLLLTAALAVLGFFATDRRGENLWRTLIAPGLSVLGLALVLVLVLANVAILLGVAADSPWRWIVPGTYLAVALAGYGYGRILRATRPTTYAAVGRGARAALPAQALPMSGLLLPNYPVTPDPDPDVPCSGSSWRDS